MKFAGRAAFMTLLPLLRRYLSRTERSYVMVVCDKEIVLVKNWLSRQKWQLPGGGIRKTETSAVAAAREIREELGIAVDVRRLKKITSGVWQTDRLGFKYQIFAIQLQEKPPIKLLKPEIIEACWLPAGKIEPAQTTPEIYEAIRGYLI